MENKLTNEERTRIFAMYIGSEFMYEGNEPDELYGVMKDDVAYGSDADESGEGIYSISDCKLLLTPLAKISDEHARALSECCFPDGNQHDYLHGAPTGKAIVATIKSGRQTNTFYPMARMYDCFQYLIQQGYAVPLFFGLNHWANGKTAIELGIAIDKP